MVIIPRENVLVSGGTVTFPLYGGLAQKGWPLSLGIRSVVQRDGHCPLRDEALSGGTAAFPQVFKAPERAPGRR